MYRTFVTFLLAFAAICTLISLFALFIPLIVRIILSIIGVTIFITGLAYTLNMMKNITTSNTISTEPDSEDDDTKSNKPPIYVEDIIDSESPPSYSN